MYNIDNDTPSFDDRTASAITCVRAGIWLDVELAVS
jgi:hypothetical protein